jgi:hypothetical protein
MVKRTYVRWQIVVVPSNGAKRARGLDKGAAHNAEDVTANLAVRREGEVL